MKVKATHKLIPAIAMLIVSLVLISSASFAWFTMSKEVTATGMTLTAVAPNNLLISSTFGGTYAETASITTPAGLGKLIPASSVDALKFFATDNVLSKDAGAPIVTTKFIDASNDPVATASHDGYYYDFDLFLKTTGAQDVVVNLLRASTTIDTAAKINGAVRIGFLNAGNDAKDGAAITGSSAGIYDFNGKADYFTTVVGPIVGPLVSGIPTDTFKGTATEMLKDDKAIAPSDVFTVLANEKITHIIVRVWVEGQDKDCINSLVDTTAFNIGVGFKDKTNPN